MIDPCALPETGWGWLALVTVSLTLLGLGVAFVALPRRSWMALVGAAAMAVVGIGGATSVDAQSEDECHSVRIINAGSTSFDPTWAVVPNVGDMLVCEYEGTYAPGNVAAPAGVIGGPTQNCVEFPTGSAVGAVTYLVLSSAESRIVAVQDHEDFTGIGLWRFEPGAQQIEFFEDDVSAYSGCGTPGYSVPPHQVGNGDTVWVGSATSC